MEIKLKEWIIELDKLSEEIREVFGGLDNKILFTKPDSKSWSIAENLDHLIKVNSSYFPIFRQLIDQTFVGAFIGKFKFFTKLFGNMIYTSVSDGGKKKIRTFPLWEPRINEGENDIIEKFLDHQEELKNWIKELEPYIEKETIIHSPANKLIVYSLPQAMDIVIAHEKRHLNQALAVLEKIKK
ncbi:DinB family protein [Cecembia rubra]|uniref:DinB family protein n=1 Tax=Cecembia rubra TaxID=1485585 RepID=A0A2P8ED40_9BACT|nr:DinB family protein [Cecembia rubra]PSL07392.1 DinB family protein [Cecembia rubra]